MTNTEFLQRFPTKTKTGDQWLVKCPSHDDAKASLAVSEGASGKTLLKCHAGCSTEDILAAMGLKLTDLFAEKTTTKRCEVAVYDYKDERSTLLYQAVRFEPKDFRQRRPDGTGGYIWNLKDVRRVVYRLPELQGKEAIAIVEGEKDANRLWELNIPATCNVGGAGKWRDDYTQQLIATGVQRIRIIPDNDPPGLAHARQIQSSLIAAALKRVEPLEIRIVALPDISEKGDVSDYLATRSKADLVALLKAPPTTTMSAAGTAPETHPERSRRPDKTAAQGRAVLFEDLEPWPEPVALAAVLEETAGMLARFVVLPDGAGDAIALWVAHTYLMDLWSISPFLTINSPIKQCGKTRLMTIVKAVVFRALATSNITPAALFRVIEKYGPTLLMDEAENFINDRNNELRGVLNAGHTRDTAQVVRTEGEKHEAAVFSTWAAKVVALIGKLSDTTMDRSIVVAMRRRTAAEAVSPLRHRTLVTTCEPIRRRLRRATDDHAEQIGQCDPVMPSGLRDRDQDNWAPLLAIADVAGAGWPERARRSAVMLSGGDESIDDSPGVALLQDCRVVRDEVGGEVIASADLVERLNKLEGRPWSDLKGGRGITTSWLAKHLAEFKVRSAGTIRIPGASMTKKGYRWAAFEDAWARYVAARDADCDGSNVPCDGSCDVSEPQIHPMNTESCYGVTAVTALREIGKGKPESSSLRQADGWLEI